jgi:hypothetical protein
MVPGCWSLYTLNHVDKERGAILCLCRGLQRDAANPGAQGQGFAIRCGPKGLVLFFGDQDSDDFDLPF